MPPGPVGSVWAAGSWSNVCWEADTWATAVAVWSNYRNDLTAAVMDDLENNRRPLIVAPQLADTDSLMMQEGGQVEDAWQDAAPEPADINTELWMYLTW